MSLKLDFVDNAMNRQVKHECRTLNPNDELVLPLHKRIIVQYSPGENGELELHLYYGDKEISFDEPEYFIFGEKLAKQSRFIAKSAIDWDVSIEWPKIKELLEQLIDEGILHFADSFDAEAIIASKEGFCPSPLPPAATGKAQTWLECEAITKELTGKALELGYLELLMPIFRIAHIALDAEGRQVGEANVFPKPLRLDVPTDWRTCPYPGSRYLDERPMNITALKSMRQYWSQMMVVLLKIREAFLQRFPSQQQGWTVGGLEALSSLVLAVPTYQLMRTGQRVENGQLHPALSSIFRVTDGLRMVIHQMIFVPYGEPTLAPSSPITSSEIYEYSERNYAFSSDYGVCAGPKVMIEEFLNVIVNGNPIKDAESVMMDEQVLLALGELDAAFDYGLYGLQAFAVIFSFWPVMTRTYAQLWTILDDWAGEKPDNLIIFRDRIQTQINRLNAQSYHAKEEWRTNREQAYSEIYEFCGEGLGQGKESKSLTERIRLGIQTDSRPIEVQLRSVLMRYLANDILANNSNVEKLIRCLTDFFRQTQAIISIACETQTNINRLLKRSSPNEEFGINDINLHNILQGNAENRLAFLSDELEDILNIRIQINKQDIQLEALCK